MRKNNIGQTFVLLLILLGAFSHKSACLAQEAPRISPYLLFSYLKDTDSKKNLQVRMTNITPTGEVALPGRKIGFYNDETLLGELVTDAGGNASHTISDSVQLFRNEDGSWPFSVVFEGDSLTDPAGGELSILDVNVEMKLSDEEGQKTVTLYASVPSSEGPVPVTGEEIGVYVPRMFSLLPVSTGVLDESGTFRTKFPDNIPGDSLGNLTVIGRFNDNYFYGNVEKREETVWGVKAEGAVPVYRSLWSTLAPKWMVVTLAIMLLGVWGHYTLVIINLIRIRKDSLKSRE